MLELEITKEILTSFVGTLLALLSAGLVWFLKLAYEKHRSEVLALAKFERIFAINITVLKDNFEFIDKWISALSQNRPFSFHFENYFVSEEETYKLSNLELINRILSINYKLRRTGLDLNNIYKSYWDTIFRINSIQDEMRKNNNLEAYHGTVKNMLEQMKLNYEPLKNDLIDAVALIRAAHKVRFHSLFGYVSLMSIDVFPRITKKSIEKEVVLLKNNIERNEKGIK